MPSSGPWASAYTDADGYYTVSTGVGPGDYVVEFLPSWVDGSPSAYAPEYWDDAVFAEDATVLTITDTTPVTVNGALSMGGSISGTISVDGLSPVYEADDGSGPIRTPAARAYMYNPTSGEWEERGAIDAELDGSYTIPGLAAGTYRVGFHAHACSTGYIPDFWNGVDPTVYYDDQPTIDLADDVVVTGGDDTPGIDGLLRSLHLPTTGTISGTVTNPYGGLEGGMVAIVDPWTTVPVNPDGSYSFTGVAPGTYDILFATFPGAAEEYYDDAPSLADATHVTVVAGEDTVGVDAVLGPEAVISGNITVPSDFTSPTVCIGAFLANGELRRYDCGDVGEPLVLNNLQAGTFYLHLLDTDDPWNPGWDAFAGADGWYANADTIDDATAVTVGVGETVAINLVWDEPTVSDVSPSSGPTTGGTSVTITGDHFVDVTSVTFNGVAGTGMFVASDTELTVSAPAGSAGAADVVVTTLFGSSDPAVFTYVAATTGTISGTVTMEGGGPANGGTVWIHDGTGNPIRVTGVSEENGGYDVDGLEPGVYYVLFHGFAMSVEEWYENAGRETATPVVVTAGDVTTVDAELAAGGQISGSVTLEGGGSAGVGDVEVYDAEGTLVTWGTADTLGNYTLQGLAEGDYYLTFVGFEWGAGSGTRTRPAARPRRPWRLRRVRRHRESTRCFPLAAGSPAR